MAKFDEINIGVTQINTLNRNGKVASICVTQNHTRFDIYGWRTALLVDPLFLRIEFENSWIF